MTDYAWFPVTGDGASAATAYIWNVGTFAFGSGGDWVDVDAVPPYPPVTGTAPGAVSGGAPQDSAYLVAGQGSGSAINQFYHPNPAKGTPFIATGADGNYDFATDVLLNSGSVGLVTLGLEQANVLAGPFAPTLDIEGATLHVTGSVVSTYNANRLPPGLSAAVADAAPYAGLLGVTLPQPGGTVEIGGGGTLEVGGSIDPGVAIRFAGGSGNLLRLDGGGTPSDTIFGFTSGDTIDLATVPDSLVGGVSIAAGTTLAIAETGGTTLDLALDPAQSFAGLTVAASSDGHGGTDLGFGAPVPSSTYSDGGASADLVGSNGADIFLGSVGNDTIVSGNGQSEIVPGSGNDVIYAHGPDIIFPDAGGSEIIFAFGPVLAAVGSGTMYFVNGNSPSTVIGGGGGSAVIAAGAGGGLYAGGTGGTNYILGGAGACTMFGSSGSDLLAAAGANADLLIAGSGNETLTGTGSTGANVFYAGSGNDLLGGGTGPETFNAGSGHATVIGGSGPDFYGFAAGLGGTETIFGFSAAKGDRIVLPGFGAGEAANDLASAGVSGGTTTLTLSDHTQVTFVGVTGLGASAFV